MTAEQKQFLKDLSEKYDLTKDDFFLQKSQGWVIIKRTGIDKIQGKEAIEVEFNLEEYDTARNIVVVKARGSYKEKYIESYGEANQGNCKNLYPVAMAEKRALSRVVLKLVGAYAEGIYSEDEADEFKD